MNIYLAYFILWLAGSVFLGAVLDDGTGFIKAMVASLAIQAFIAAMALVIIVIFLAAQTVGLL